MTCERLPDEDERTTTQASFRSHDGGKTWERWVSTERSCTRVTKVTLKYDGSSTVERFGHHLETRSTTTPVTLEQVRAGRAAGETEAAYIAFQHDGHEFYEDLATVDKYGEDAIRLTNAIRLKAKRTHIDGIEALEELVNIPELRELVGLLKRKKASPPQI